MKCQFENCDQDSISRGMCKKHYQRWLRYGDPTVCKVAPRGECLRFLFEDVLSYQGEDCFWWPYAHSDGYGIVKIDEVNHYVHVVVCETVNGPRPSQDHVASHKCGKGHLGCCNSRHLKWQTRSEDHADRVTHGTSNRGLQHGMSKLTEKHVLEIRSLEGKLSQTEIAKKFGVTQVTISQIMRRLTWGWLEK